MYDLPPEFYRWMADAKGRGSTTYQEMVTFLRDQEQEVTPELRESFLQLIHASGIDVIDNGEGD